MKWSNMVLKRAICLTWTFVSTSERQVLKDQDCHPSCILKISRYQDGWSSFTPSRWWIYSSLFWETQQPTMINDLSACIMICCSVAHSCPWDIGTSWICFYLNSQIIIVVSPAVKSSHSPRSSPINKACPHSELQLTGWGFFWHCCTVAGQNHKADTGCIYNKYFHFAEIFNMSLKYCILWLPN